MKNETSGAGPKIEDASLEQLLEAKCNALEQLLGLQGHLQMLTNEIKSRRQAVGVKAKGE